MSPPQLVAEEAAARFRETHEKVRVSPRDVRAAYEAKVVDLMNRFFDMLLIHGDPRLCSLGESFSRLGELRADSRDQSGG